MKQSIKKAHLALIKNTVLASSLVGLLFAQSINAHERFMVPSHTVLSGDKTQYATIISSISNDIFHPDRPLGDNGKGVDAGDLKPLFAMLQSRVILPDGKIDNSVEWQAYQRMSIADVPLEQSGTYRVSLIQQDVAMTTFKKADGAPWRLFGKDITLPEGATDVVRRTTASSVETFISVNKPTLTAVNPTGKGLELVGQTHPNDLFAGETASFQLLFNGKPVSKGTHVKAIKAGTRHRNNRNEQVLTLNDKGEFTFTPQSSGFYFLAAESAVEVAQPSDVDVKHFSLYLTLEVFPE
jgi:hypothetical protein